VSEGNKVKEKTSYAYKANERELRAALSDKNSHAELHKPTSKTPQNCSKWQRTTTTTPRKFQH
jgi:hypothetical protein